MNKEECKVLDKFKEECKVLENFKEDADGSALALRSEVERIVKKNEDKSWRIKVKGEEVNLKDIGANIVCWLNKFVAIGDIIVQYDPVHTALPWAAFRFFLTVSICIPVMTEPSNAI